MSLLPSSSSLRHRPILTSAFCFNITSQILPLTLQAYLGGGAGDTAGWWRTPLRHHYRVTRWQLRRYSSGLYAGRKGFDYRNRLEIIYSTVPILLATGYRGLFPRK
jgi:hypothetical protein